jgi:hypothetical protein
MWRTQSMCCGARSARRSGEHQPGEECDLPATSARHSLPATSAYQAYRTSLASNYPRARTGTRLALHLPQSGSFHETTRQEEH